jgi:hypothetical protein
VRSASVSETGARYFSSISAKVRAFLCLDIVKLFVHRALPTGIRTFITVSVAVYWILQCCHIEMLCCAVMCSVLESGSLLYLLLQGIGT